MELGERLDRLVAAFEGHGVDVRSNLLPGATPAEIDAVEAELGVQLPRAYRDLYGWSAGCVDRDSESALVFRDNAFLPLAEVVGLRHQLVEAYADPAAGPLDPLDDLGVDLTATAPLAELMGSTYVVACGDHRLEPASANPVIGVFEGIDVYFLSIESMVETCIAWVEQPGYEPSLAAPDELAIWRRHNPGVFE